MNKRRDFFWKSLIGVVGTGLLLGAKKPFKDEDNLVWHDETDIAVIGAGTGLVGAIAALKNGSRVVILEKAASPGGTTAISGGVAWVPNNHVMNREGFNDSKTDTLKYLNQLSQGQADQDLIEAFATEGPRMVKFLEDNTSLKWQVSQIMGEASEYHTDWEGSVLKGRSIEPDSDAPFGAHLGGYLVSYLLKAFNNLGGKIILKAPAQHLISRENEDGSREVLGVSYLLNGKTFNLKTKKGVHLASGGFDHNEEMKKNFLSVPSYGVGVKSNTGDGIKMAMKLGADLRNMNEVWGSVVYKGEAGRLGSLNAVTEKKYYPSCILVNRYGKRFANEKADYDSSWRSFHAKENWGALKYKNIPAFQIYDHKVRKNGTLGGKTANQPLPKWFAKSSSIEGLAKKLGIDQANLKLTISNFNKSAAQGIDPDFHRGETYYDRMGLDNTSLALQPLDLPPFYGAEIAPAHLGTCGGPRVNKFSEVLDVNETPIKRLCASGNSSGVGSPGPSYGGGGGTLGPALTFSFIAGNTLSSLDDWA